MYKKSSFDFGLKVLSNILVMPLALTAAALSENKSRQSSSSTVKSVQRQKHHVSIESGHEPSIVDLMTPRLMYIRNDYNTRLKENKRVGNEISQTQKKIERLQGILSTFGQLKFVRRSIENRAQILSETLGTLWEKFHYTEIRIKNETLSSREDIPIRISADSATYFALFPIYDYSIINDLDKQCYGQEAFYHFDVPYICSLKFYSYQISFFDKLMVVASRKDFAIIDYSCIKSNVYQIYLSENIQGKDYGDRVQEKWLHACADGSRDLRYRYNPKILKVKYWYLAMKVRDKYDISLLFTDKDTAYKILSIINESTEAFCDKAITAADCINEDVRATLTESQAKLVAMIKMLGFQKNKYVSTKRPQIGSYVRRMRDDAILYVVSTPIDNGEYICYDFMSDKCFVYKKEALRLL